MSSPLKNVWFRVWDLPSPVFPNIEMTFPEDDASQPSFVQNRVPESTESCSVWSRRRNDRQSSAPPWRLRLCRSWVTRSGMLDLLLEVIMAELHLPWPFVRNRSSWLCPFTIIGSSDSIMADLASITVLSMRQSLGGHQKISEINKIFSKMEILHKICILNSHCFRLSSHLFL